MESTKRFKIITWFIIAIMLLESIVSNGIIGRKAIAIDDSMLAACSESENQSALESDEDEKEESEENTQEENSEEQEDNNAKEQLDQNEEEEKITSQEPLDETAIRQVKGVNRAPAANNLNSTGQFELNNALNSVGLFKDGSISEDTPWELDNGTAYCARLSFSEATGNELPKDETEMVYTLPSNISMVSGSTGTFKMAFGNITVPGTYRVDGQI